MGSTGPSVSAGDGWRKTSHSPGDPAACLQVGPAVLKNGFIWMVKADGTVSRGAPVGRLGPSGIEQLPATDGTAPPTTVGTLPPPSEEIRPPVTSTGAGLSFADVPAGVSWRQVRWARSWGLKFTAEPGSFYAAALAANGGTLPVPGSDERIGQVTEFRRRLWALMANDRPFGRLENWPTIAEIFRFETHALARRGRPGQSLTADETRELDAAIDARIGNGQAWDQIMAAVLDPDHWPQLDQALAPTLVSRYFGVSPVAVGPDATIGVVGSGRPIIVAEVAGEDSPRWVGVVPAGGEETSPLAGLSGPQVASAAETKLGFVEVGQEGFFDAVLTSSGGSVTTGGSVIGDARRFREELARQMRAQGNILDSGSQALLAAAYAEAYVRRGAPLSAEQAQEVREQAGRRIESGDAWEEIIAGIQAPGTADVLDQEFLPLFAQLYLGIPLRVIGADGEVGPYGTDAGATVARVTPDDGPPYWVATQPIAGAPVHEHDPATWPERIAGGRLNGLGTGFGPLVTPLTPETSGAPGSISGPVPAGTGPEQVRWARSNGMRFAGEGDLFEAVLSAADGGFVDYDGLFIDNVARFRTELARQVREDPERHPDLWVELYAIYAASYRAAQAGEREQQGLGPLSVDDLLALGEDIDRRIESGQAFAEIVAAIEEPGRDEALADALVPYLAGHHFGLDVRVVEQDGSVREHGLGRPVYITRAGSQWAALTPVGSVLPTGAAAGADPVVSGLLWAIKDRKDAIMAAGRDPSAFRDDAELGRLRKALEDWSGRSGSDAPPAGTHAVDVDWLTETVATLQSTPSVSVLAGLGTALYPQGGIGSGAWEVGDSWQDLIGAVPTDGAAFIVFPDAADPGRAGEVMALVSTRMGMRVVTTRGPGADGPMKVAAPSPSLITAMPPLDGAKVRITGADGTTVSLPRTHAVTGPAAQSTPGVNAYYDTVLKAAGGQIVTGQGVQITQPMQLRSELAWRMKNNPPAGGVSAWPYLNAVYIFEARERIISGRAEEGLGGFKADDDRPVHEQIKRHLDTGTAWDYITTAVARPGHWDELEHQLAPFLLKLYLGLDTQSAPAISTEPTPALDASAEQEQWAADNGLQLRGADSFYQAVLDAAGGGFLPQRGMFIDTASGLKEELARRIRANPGLTDDAIPQDLEEVIDAITDPQTNPALAEQVTPPLIARYFGFDLGIVAPDGAVSRHGTGRSITVASTTPDDRPGWASYVRPLPPAESRPLPYETWQQPAATGVPDTIGTAFPPLGDITDRLRQAVAAQDAADRPRKQPPHPPQRKGRRIGWRESSFSQSEYCVQVSVVAV